MLFCTKLQDISIKKIMTSVPGFPPKGFGTFINNRHSYTAKECDCTLSFQIVENCGLSYTKSNFEVVKGKAKPKLTSGTLPPCSPCVAVSADVGVNTRPTENEPCSPF